MTDEPAPPSFSVTPLDLMKMSLAEFIEDGLPHHTIINLLFLADTEIEFFVGMQAAVELKDLVLDHYDKEREPDDYPFDETDDGTEDDFRDDDNEDY